MTAIVLTAVGSLQETTTAEATINSNFSNVRNAFLASVPISGTTMAGSIDMNSNRILNLPPPASLNEPARLADLNNISGGGGTSIGLVAGTGINVTSSGGNNVVSMATTPVVAATYGATSLIPQIVINQQGQITSATNLSPTILASSITGSFVATVTAGQNITSSVTGNAVTIGFSGILPGSSMTPVNLATSANGGVTGTLSSSNVSVISLASSGNGGVTGSLPVNNLNSGNNANTFTFWRGDGSWGIPSATGAVNPGTSGQLSYYATSGAGVSGTPIANITGTTLVLGSSGTAGSIALSGATSGSVTMSPLNGAATGTLSIPNGSGTLLATNGIATAFLGNNKSVSGATASIFGSGFSTFSTINSSRVIACIQGGIQETAATSLIILSAYIGTGASPTTSVTTSGHTVLSGSLTLLNNNTAAIVPITLIAVASGLVPATSYWIDLGSTPIVGSGTVTIVNPSLTIHEI